MNISVSKLSKSTWESVSLFRDSDYYENIENDLLTSDCEESSLDEVSSKGVSKIYGTQQFL